MRLEQAVTDHVTYKLADHVGSGLPMTRLIVFSDDWGRHPSSCQHLVRELLMGNRLCCGGGCPGCREHRVLWVNTIGTRRPSLTPGDMARVVSKVGSWLATQTPGVATMPDLHVINPKMWPGFRRPWQRRINAASIAWQVDETLGRRRDEQRVAVTTLPITADLVGRLDVDRWVYYCVDDFSVWPGLDSDVMQAMERELVAKVDDVVAVSRALQHRMASMGRDAMLLTHGINLEHWKSAGENYAKPQAAWEGMPGVTRPVVLFWGLIDKRLDAQWCQALSQALQRRGGTLVLAGPQQSPDPAIRQLPNTVLPGPVAYDDLPDWAARADVLVMPYVDAPVTRAMQPLKFKEYLATGRPVVVRDLPATRSWKDAADIADDADTFVDLVLTRAETGVTISQAQARSRLAAETWSNKARQFTALWTAGSNESETVRRAA